MKSILHKIGPLAGLGIFIAALWYLNHELRHYNINEILRQLSAVPLVRLIPAVIFTAGSYGALTLYDFLAFRYINNNMSYSRIGITGFIGYAFSNNIGLSLITGGSVRYRIYSSWGLSGMDITRIVAFCGLTLWTGFLFLSGVIFLISPPEGAASVIPLQLVGIIFLALVAVYLTASFRLAKPIGIGNWKVEIPKPRIAIEQVIVSSIDWTLSGAALYILLPLHQIGFIPFLGLYLLAQISGILSQVPGGLGVFESVMVFFLSHYAGISQILGTLILFRLVYYVLPLMIAILFMAWQETKIQKQHIGELTRRMAEWLPGIVPQVLSMSILLAGGILLFSGATPAEITRLNWLRDFFPLSVIEISHFLASLSGVLLLILARGILRRIDMAYLLTIMALSAGIVFSLLKGVDYEEAVILAVILLAFIPSRPFFYRNASIISQKFTVGWVVTILLIVGSSVWLGYFSFHHVEYSNQLWWKFTLRGDAPRTLRAMVGVLVFLMAYGFFRLMKVSYAPKTVHIEDDRRHIKSVIANSLYTDANLALTGDKNIFFNKTGDAFIMYAIEGRSWVSMGDPVGSVEQIRELLWDFRDECEYYEGWPVFYQVREANASKYIDLGLILLKLGEEALVNISDFSLGGGERKVMRYHYHKIEKQDFLFEVIPSGELPEYFDDLRAISDQWLKNKKIREKRFSLGFFDETYLSNFPVAVIRHEDKIVAFANLWMTGFKNELSLDLMRHLPNLPNGIMDYLFIKLIFWGQENGYEWLNLGMAPLSGVNRKDITPAWNRLANLVYTHGEHFYNFQGLRSYKEKFDPVWESRYLACPGGLALPGVLKNVTSLISGKPMKTPAKIRKQVAVKPAKVPSLRST